MLFVIDAHIPPGNPDLGLAVQVTHINLGIALNNEKRLNCSSNTVYLKSPQSVKRKLALS